MTNGTNTQSDPNKEDREEELILEDTAIHELQAKALTVNKWTVPHFILREDDVTDYAPQAGEVDRFLSRSLFYSDRIVLVTPEVEYGRSHPGGHPLVTKAYHDEIFYGHSKIKPFLEQYHSRDLRQKILDSCVFIPEKVTVYNSYYDSYDYLEGEDTEEKFNFQERVSNPNGLQTSFHPNRYSASAGSEQTCPSGVSQRLRIKAPFFENVPLEVLLKLRENEDLHFLKFQNELKKILRAEQQLEDSRRLSEAFEVLEAEVLAIETKMKVVIGRSRVLSAAQAGIGITGFVLSFVLPGELAQLMTAALGSKCFLDVVTELKADLANTKDIKLNNFYFPWLVYRQSKR